MEFVCTYRDVFVNLLKLLHLQVRLNGQLIDTEVVVPGGHATRCGLGRHHGHKGYQKDW